MGFQENITGLSTKAALLWIEETLHHHMMVSQVNKARFPDSTARIPETYEMQSTIL